MKYSDDLYDIKHNLPYASIFGVVCGIASGVASIYSFEAAYIFLAILIGTFLAFKIDGIHHLITLIVFIVILLIGGIPHLDMVVLLICSLAAMLDEVGHELISKFTQNKFLNLFFEYRFVMKIIIILLAIGGVFNIWLFFCFILFEASYLFGGMFFESLN